MSRYKAHRNTQQRPEYPLLQRPEASTSKLTFNRVPLANAAETSENPFLIAKDQGKNYTKQYANLYFMRLAKLKSRVLAKAASKWSTVSPDAKALQRVLDVDQGQMCWIVGTIYMEMKLKPNVIQEMAREVCSYSHVHHSLMSVRSTI